MNLEEKAHKSIIYSIGRELEKFLINFGDFSYITVASV